jgi:hypothetical protein
LKDLGIEELKNKSGLAFASNLQPQTYDIINLEPESLTIGICAGINSLI